MSTGPSETVPPVSLACRLLSSGKADVALRYQDAFRSVVMVLTLRYPKSPKFWWGVLDLAGA
jgi:hypothetical protein